PRKVSGSSQRSPLHAAGTRCLHLGKCACKQAAARTFTVIGGVSGSKRQTRPPESHRFLAKVPLHAAGTRCLHFGKCACKQATTRFPPTKERAARPNG